MKIFAYIILLLASSPLFGQQLDFRGEGVDTIEVKSLSRFYNPGDNSIHGNIHFMSLTFDKTTDSYVVDRFYKEKFDRTSEPDTLIVEQKSKRSKVGKKAERLLLRNLLTALITPLESRDLIDQVDTTKLKSYLTGRRIRKTLTARGRWCFTKYDATKQERKDFYKSCRSVDTLKIYLNKRFGSSGWPMMTHFTNTMDIWIKSKNINVGYEGKGLNPVRQPWYISDDLQVSGTPLQFIVNLDVNASLYDLLPQRFLHRESISEKALAEDYIRWCQANTCGSLY